MREKRLRRRLIVSQNDKKIPWPAFCKVSHPHEFQTQLLHSIDWIKGRRTWKKRNNNTQNCFKRTYRKLPFAANVKRGNYCRGPSLQMHTPQILDLQMHILPSGLSTSSWRQQDQENALDSYWLQKKGSKSERFKKKVHLSLERNKNYKRAHLVAVSSEIYLGEGVTTLSTTSWRVPHF